MNESDSSSAGDQYATRRRRGPFRVLFECLIVMTCLSGLALVAWLRMSELGREVTARGIEKFSAANLAADETKAADQLRQRGVLVIVEPPEKHVKTVNFVGKEVDAESLASLKALYQLQCILFTDTNVADDDLRNLSGLKHLSSLTLSRTGVTDAGISHLVGLPELQSLSLHTTAIGDAALAEIAKIEDLRVLDLSETRITDQGLPALLKLRKLTWLLIQNTAISDAGMTPFENLSSLRRLTIKGSKVSKECTDRMQAKNPKLGVD